MTSLNFYNCLSNNINYNNRILIENSLEKISLIGTIRSKEFLDNSINWFESPYGYTNLTLNTNSNKEYSELSVDKLLHEGSIACIFIRPTISNLLDFQIYKRLSNNGYMYLNGGNNIYYLSKTKFRGLKPEEFIAKKRLSKIRKANKYNNVKLFRTNQLIDQGLFSTVSQLYIETMKKKNAPSFYFFNNLWLNPNALNESNALFYLSFDKASHDILGFLIVIGTTEQNIFISASNLRGREYETLSLLRYKAISDFLLNKDVEILNMGGVNIQHGGDESFKKSFGGLSIPYKLIIKFNQSIYFETLKKANKLYDENNIRFWL